MTESPIKFFSWLIGERVSRKDTDEQGGVLETMPRLKVKWDDGATSYFRRDRPGNVRKL
jgi:hypothetical protein